MSQPSPAFGDRGRPPLDLRGAHVFARLLAGQDVNGEMSLVADSWQSAATYLARLEPDSRGSAFEAILHGPGIDRETILRALAEADPLGPPPGIEESDDTASLEDIRQQIAAARWDWKGWIAKGVLAAIAANPGVGKTVLAVWIALCLWRCRALPDGQDSPFAERTRTLWVPADRHFTQLLDLAERYELPGEAMLFNAPRSNATGGLDLDDPAELDALERRIRAHRPGLVIIDTVGMTTGKDLCRPEGAREYFGPLMDIAQATETSFLLLTHLSQNAEALGRRIVGACRTVWTLTAPDPDSQPNRRRLWVSKSFVERPPALGMSITDSGLTFDANPPVAPEPNKGGRPAEAKGKAEAFLRERLSTNNGQRWQDLASEWEKTGGNRKTFGRAVDSLKGLGELITDGGEGTRKPMVLNLLPREGGATQGTF